MRKKSSSNLASSNVHVRIALVGFGMWGRNLARVFHQLGALVTICETNKDYLAEAKKTYPGISLTASFAEVLSKSDIQGVVIASPPVSHKVLAMQAFKAGKHVFVEKPLALSAVDGNEIMQCAADNHKTLLVGHVLEYHSAILKLREFIKEGLLGKLQYFYSHRLNFGRIRTEENSLWSFAPHDIAVMLRLLDAFPQTIACLGGNYLNRSLADTTMTTLEFSTGIQAHIFVSWLHPFKVHRMVLIGDQRMAVFDDTQVWEKKLILYPHKVDWVGGKIPVARQAEGVPVILDKKEPLLSECEHFLDCIREGNEPLTNGRKAVDVLLVLEAAQHSLAKHGQVLNFDLFLKPTEGASTQMTNEVTIHPTAVVDPKAVIGRGTKVWHFAHVMGGVCIGEDCILGQNTFVGKNVRLGNGVKVQNNVSLYDGVVLEDAVFCGPSVVFTNVINPRSEFDRKKEFKTTLVKKGATLGANATLICGVTIGQYAFVAAGAVVTKNVEDYALVKGVPAKFSGWICQCGQQMTNRKTRIICCACQRCYQRKGERLEMVI